MHTRKVAASLAALTLLVYQPAASAQQSPDRTRPPAVGAAKPLIFPKAQTRKLANGIPIVVLEDHSSPVVSVAAIIDVPTALEPSGKTGISGALGAMLGEGTMTMTADQLANAFADLGNRVSATGFFTITPNVDRSIALMADQLMHPSFPEDALTRVKANQVAAITRAKESPYYLATRAAAVIYGKGHPYARSATEAEVNSLTRADIEAFYDKYYRPPNVTLVVGGDITPEQAVAKLSHAFGTWKSGDKATTTIPAPKGVSSETIYLVDRPSSPQTVFLIGAIGPPRDAPDFFATDLANITLGGAFTSRVNLNLREDKHYTYGANSFFSYRRVPEPSTFMVMTAVATPKTDSSLVQLVKELSDIRGPRPVTASELAFARGSATKGFPLEFETISARVRAIGGLIRQGLPLDYYNTVVQKYAAVSQADEQRSVMQHLDPARMAIIMVGDRKVIEPGVRAANVAPIVIIDEDGNPVN